MGKIVRLTLTTLPEQMAARAYGNRRQRPAQERTAEHVRERRKWANAGAGLDIAQVRAKDRALCGGILPPSVSRPADGRIHVAALWECQGEAHARFCNCEAWDANGQPEAAL